MGVKTPAEQFASNLKVTAGSRFNAAERLRAREKSSNFLTSIYSALLICISIATFSLPFDSISIKYFSFGGIVVSILLLVVSMRNYSHQYGLEAEQMHRCALEINEVLRLWTALSQLEQNKQMEQYAQRYNAILQKWSINHTEGDFLKYKYKHKWEFEDICDIPDEKLPDKKFKELYETSAGGVALATVIGIIFIAFIGYIVWDSISMKNETVILDSAIENAQQALDRAANAAEAAANEQVNSVSYSN